MRKRMVVILTVLTLNVINPKVILYAEDETVNEGVASHGVTHNVAPDREIVKIGGRYEPEGIDFYLKKKFDALDATIAAAVDKIDQLEKKFDRTNEQLELMLNKMAAQNSGSR